MEEITRASRVFVYPRSRTLPLYSSGAGAHARGAIGVDRDITLHVEECWVPGKAFVSFNEYERGVSWTKCMTGSVRVKG